MRRLIRRDAGAMLWLAAVLATAACGAPEPAPSPLREAAGPAWTARPLRDVTFERTAERRARGEYLVTGVLQCFVCHSERDWTRPGAPPVEGRAGAGAVWGDKPWLVAPNLTPDVETGIGRWTDDMLDRAIREGVGHDGRRLHDQMWSASFSGLVDADLASVVVYLRSLAPIRNPLPATAVPADIAATFGAPSPLPPEPPDLSTPIARGRYLSGLADCSGCHTSWHTPRNPGNYGGGNLILRSDHQAYSSNLTRDPSGIPYYDAALFREVMRQGNVKGRALSPVMPWTAFRHMTDGDLDAMFAYLSAHRPVKHVVDNVNAPSACAICGGTHPLGEYNRLREATPMAYAMTGVSDVAGAYRFYPAYTMVVFARDRRLFLQEEGSDEACELVTEDGRRFRCAEETDEIEFVRDASGRVTHLVGNGVEPAPKIR